MKQNKLETISNLFEGKKIRSFWDSDKEDYYFSVVDVIAAFTDNDYAKAKNYWSDLKRKLKQEGSELHENIVQLELMSLRDGKYYNIDVLDTEGIFRLIESISSPKAELFKIHLAKLGCERINEVFDPEITINRAISYYRQRGYTYEWIKNRLIGIIERN